jgi:FkbM family methyltransferase
MRLFKDIPRRSLLRVFQFKQFVRSWFGVRRLDYGPKDIYISTDTIREYETRARSVSKEPKTVAWIEKHGGGNAVLYDVGANIGAYSLIAAARGAQVVAFEPAHQNIYKLHENILLNKLSENIIVAPLVLAAHSATVRSVIKQGGFGASHSFSALERPPDAEHSQAFLAIGLDDCIQAFSLPIPTMLKIDVDGAEGEVLEGAPKLLASKKLKTILIEVEEDNNRPLQQITDTGFTCVDQEKSGTSTINYIFERT